MDKVKSLNGKLEGLQKEIVSLDDFTKSWKEVSWKYRSSSCTCPDQLYKVKSLEGKLEGLQKRDFVPWWPQKMSRKGLYNEQTLFNLWAAISHLMEQTKKQTIPQAIRMPTMSGVNLPWIEVPMFDSTIPNWRPFWEPFQDTFHNKSHLEDVDKLTYLRDALKGRPDMYLIQGLTKMAESYGEFINCVKNWYSYNHPRLTHHEHAQSLLQAPIMKCIKGREQAH